jgi:hypothetical protein
VNLSITQNLAAVLTTRALPAITFRNRLEGRPRTENFTRALKAEVRDALWMITRQWQMGEFLGDDAGSPIFAKLRMATTKLGKYQPDSHAAEAFDETTPLEAKVEKRPLSLTRQGRDISLDLRLVMGRHWLKMIAPLGAAARTEFVNHYAIHQPNPADAKDAAYCAHPDAWSAFRAVSGRRMDGGKLYLHLLNAGATASDNLPALAALKPQIDPLGVKFLQWVRRLFYLPDGPDAWIADRLEYQFSCSAPSIPTADAPEETVLAAEEYYHGHLDWYNFTIDRNTAKLGDVVPAPRAPPKPLVTTTLPTAVTFNGMPNTRWWTFEDSRTNFGDIKPDTTDLAKLMLMDFGLIYANDWFLIPYTVPAGSIARIQGLAVTNVFGERTWVEAAGRDAREWQFGALLFLRA